MAQYRVLQKSFVNDVLVEEGAVVDYDGVPGSNLELIRKKGVVSGPAPEEEVSFPGSEPEQPLV
jgi:hypothetical protein